MVPYRNWSPGETQLELTSRPICYHPELRHHVRKIKCSLCQRHKSLEKGYVLLPERDVTSQPFQEVAVGLTGPRPIEIGNKDTTVMALIIIDPVTNLL